MKRNFLQLVQFLFVDAQEIKYIMDFVPNQLQ